MKRTVVHLVIALCAVGSVRADQTIQSVQQALADQGFYYGNVTGEKTVETTAAIPRYQIRNGLQITGEINPETLRSLNVASNSVSSPPRTTKSPVTQPSSVRPDDSSRLGPVLAPSRINVRIVVEVQRQLVSRGYYRGWVDGRYGRGTAFAVRAFQLRSGISPTGRLDVTTLDALGLSPQNLA